MAPRHVTVVGASLAGLRVAQSLRRQGFAGDVTLIGDEADAAYHRPSLSKQYLAGQFDVVPVLPRLEAEDCDHRMGLRAVAVDVGARTLTLQSVGDGAVQPHVFDGLVIATGATPRSLSCPVPAGVHTLRGLNDAARLRHDLARSRRVVVVGGGLIGGEVASTCRGLGLEVTVVDDGLPMARQLGQRLGKALASLHLEQGTALRIGAPVVGFEGEERVSGARLSDGSVLPADVVVLGIGARPNTDWLAGSGIEVADGVLCEANLRVREHDDIVAVGDVARWAEARTGEMVRDEHWDNAHHQAGAAATTLLTGPTAPPFDTTTMYWSEQYGQRLQVVGRPAGADTLEIVEGRVEDLRFTATYTRAGMTVGAVAVNMPHRLGALRALVGEPTSRGLGDLVAALPNA